MNKFIKHKKAIAIIIISILLIIISRIAGMLQIKESMKVIEKFTFERSYKSKLYKIENNAIEIDGKRKKTYLYGFSQGYFFVDSSQNVSFEIFLNGFCYKKNTISDKITSNIGTCTKKIYNYKSIGVEQVFIAPKNGYYTVELWGAAGGKQSLFDGMDPEYKNVFQRKNGRGAYVKGEIFLEKNDVIYIYVGGKGSDGKMLHDNDRISGFGYPSQAGSGGYNGGASGYDDPESQAGGGGGGATDIRLKSGSSDNFESLKSRIMVAGAGGGMSRYYIYNESEYEGSGKSGSGGLTTGKNGYVVKKNNDRRGYGSTQTGGYKFGIGENGLLCMTTINGLGGGAGGYYGSRTGYCNETAWLPPSGAGGGSSFVSGCKNCNAISEKSTEDAIIHTNQSVHYSKKVFKKIKMIDGDSEMPNPITGKQMIGNDFDGYARISYVFKYGGK